MINFDYPNIHGFVQVLGTALIILGVFMAIFIAIGGLGPEDHE